MRLKESSQKLVLFVILLTALFLFFASNVIAQYSQGFDFRLEWERFEEQSKGLRDIGVTDIGARAGYSFPQILDLYIALSWQDIDCTLPDTQGTVARRLDLDPALAFKVGTKVYVIRDLPIGIPADLTLAFNYNTARHEEDRTDNKYRHRRLIASTGLEWHYATTAPFFAMGVLSSKLEGPDDTNYDQTSLFIEAGADFRIIENVFFKIGISWCQEVGYTAGFKYIL